MSAIIDYPDYVRQVIDEAAKVTLDLQSAAVRAADAENPIVISVVKNEKALLPEFLTHYRSLGIERFAIIDNGSSDGSLEYLKAQKDVDCYLVTRPFLWPFKQGWINRVVAEYGYDRWYIFADADEQMVFDESERYGFRDLVDHAEHLGLRRVRGMLIDAYAEGPLLEYSRKPGQSLRKAFPLFDRDSYQEFKYKEIISRKGGPRPRCFSGGEGKFNPEMTKYPLFKLKPGELMANPHHIYPYAGNFESDCLIGVLHYKFLPGFVGKINRAISENSYWDGSSEYKRYLEILKGNPELSLVYEGTEQFRATSDLVEAGLIEKIDWRPDVRNAGQQVRMHAHRDWAARAAVGV